MNKSMISKRSKEHRGLRKDGRSTLNCSSTRLFLVILACWKSTILPRLLWRLLVYDSLNKILKNISIHKDFTIWVEVIFMMCL